jgi:hypothetical protein
MRAITGRSLWLRWSIISGAALVVLLMIANLLVYPSLRRDPQFTLYILTLVIIGVLYLALTLWWTGLAALAPALRWGAIFGLGAGLGWLIEIVAGNLAVGQPWRLPAYFGGTLIALCLTLAVGVAGAVATRSFRGGLVAGIWSGIMSGLIACLALLSLPWLFPGTLQRDAQTLAEYARSGAPDLATYIAGDYSAAAIGHLLIGLLLGLLLGALGAAIGAGLARATPERRQSTAARQ